MVEKNLRHVPVVDAGALAGMVSIKDVVQVRDGDYLIHYLIHYLILY